MEMSLAAPTQSDVVSKRCIVAWRNSVRLLPSDEEKMALIELCTVWRLNICTFLIIEVDTQHFHDPSDDLDLFTIHR